MRQRRWWFISRSTTCLHLLWSCTGPPPFLKKSTNMSQLKNSELSDKSNLQGCEYNQRGAFIWSLLVNTVNTTPFEGTGKPSLLWKSFVWPIHPTMDLFLHGCCHFYTAFVLCSHHYCPPAEYLYLDLSIVTLIGICKLLTKADSCCATSEKRKTSMNRSVNLWYVLLICRGVSLIKLTFSQRQIAEYQHFPLLHIAGLFHRYPSIDERLAEYVWKALKQTTLNYCKR